MRRWRFRIVAAAAAGMLAFAGGPARAAVPEWERIPCFSGRMVPRTLSSNGYLELTGSLDCADTGTGATFGIAHYGNAGGPPDSIFDTTLRTYSQQAPSFFMIGNRVAAEPRSFGLCLVTDYAVRVACLRVGVGPNSMLSASPISPQDPLVNRPTNGIVPGGSGGTPGCGGCW